MDNHDHDVDRIARDLFERFGELAALIARELAAVSNEVQDEIVLPAKTWCDIIDSIGRLLSKPNSL
jgi:hypothetical protein